MGSVCRWRTQGFLRTLFIGRNLVSSPRAARSRFDRELDVGGNCHALKGPRSVHQVGSRWQHTGAYGVRSGKRSLDGSGRQ